MTDRATAGTAGRGGEPDEPRGAGDLAAARAPAGVDGRDGEPAGGLGGAGDLVVAWAAVAGDSAAARAVVAELIARWSEPHRRYHTPAHLRAVLAAIEPLAGFAADTVAVRLAAWFHDAVYDGRPGWDEERSAQLATARLTRLAPPPVPSPSPAGRPGAAGGFDGPLDGGFDDGPDGGLNGRPHGGLDGGPDGGLGGGLNGGFGGGLDARRIAEVARLVRVTAGHDPAPGDRDGEVLCDADLAVLAAPGYGAYARAVREEYRHVPDEAFRAGRARVLRDLLAAPTLYRTPLARELWEAGARSNMRAELARLLGP
ncbi:HD domain-containing protein [Sphaerisporangium rhizosphaerae]|uniref:Metal-dependent phosphohydrolase n=1 Tax=Sphaerisporangium rhizosphaerae TaxID=2269375 RepID=A0ABW2PF92_9ACTN